jgi:MFS family permease
MGGYGGGDDGAVVVMPMWKRVSITAVQLFMTMLTAGVIIGWGQLEGMLQDTGVYHSKCGPAYAHNTSYICTEQSDALDQLFNIGASVSLFVQAPSGIILDFLGPRATCWVGLAMFVPGCFLFAFANIIHKFDAYMFGFQLLAAGGPFVFVSSMPVSQLWPDYKAMILMMVKGVYGGGAFVFFLFAILYNNLGISIRALFIVYGFVGCGIILLAFFVWPKRSFIEKPQKSNIQVQEDQPTVLDIINKTFRDVMTPHYIFLLFAVSFLIYKSNFFLATSPDQFQLHLPPHLYNKLNTMFGAVLPIVGVLAGPLGLIFDKAGENVALLILITLSSVSSVCGMMVHTSTNTFASLQVLRMFVFSAYYPMTYGIWAFFIVKKFGTVNFGVLYAIIAACAGVVNVTASNPLINYSLNKGSFVEANTLLVCIGAAFSIYPIVQIIRNYFTRRAGSGYYEPIA